MKFTKSGYLMIVALAYAIVAESTFAQTCQPPGEFVGGGGGYQYIANGGAEGHKLLDYYR